MSETEDSPEVLTGPAAETPAPEPPADMDREVEGEAPSREPGSLLKPGAQSAWERWELPAMDSGHVVTRGGRRAEAREEEVEARPLSLEEIEGIRESARQEGLAEGREAGYREGHEKGLAAGSDEVRVQAEALRSAIDGLAKPLARSRRELEEALAETVLEIARNVVRHELQARPETIRGIAAEAVEALAEFPGEVRVHLHPDDLALVREDPAEWLEGCALEADASIPRGGVRAERGLSTVDYTLDTRFRAAIEGFVARAYDRPVHERTEPAATSGSAAETNAAATVTAEGDTAESGAAESGAAESGAAESGAAESGAAETGAAETGAAETGADEPRAGDLPYSADETHPDEPGAAAETDAGERP